MLEKLLRGMVASLLLVGCGGEQGATSLEDLAGAEGGKADRPRGRAPFWTARPIDVVGGRAETAYGPVGYLLWGDDAEHLDGPQCGVTLIAPRVAVTAAHCLVGHLDGALGAAFLVNGTHTTFRVEKAVVHSGFDPAQTPRYLHDLAALHLVEAPPVEPARVAQAQQGQLARYVGYGRVTVGGGRVTEGYTGERKSAEQQITKLEGGSLFTRGTDGGLCWGDSGGPLMAAEREVLGVLADFDQLLYCKERNAMIFTDLSAERAFLDEVLGCPNADEPACAPPAPPAPVCAYACADYGYQPGDCWNGWICEGSCIENRGSC